MAELKVDKFTLGVCETNFYYVYEEGKKDVIAFDPADRGELCLLYTSPSPRD